MNLFKTSSVLQQADLNPLTYPRPFGDVHFDLTVNGEKIKNFKPLKTVVFQKTIISSWNIENCYIEFLQAPFKPKIPSSMQVETCIAGIWRVLCLSNEPLVTFKTTLNHSLAEFQGFPESGEGLVSIAFEDDKMQLSIGTEDEDFLRSRASVKEWMPNFSKHAFESSIELLSNGIEIDLPCLKEKDVIQIQFIVACSLKKKHHETSCWFAVEQSPEYILKESGVI